MQGRALRTTTALERISEEFRRRTKTQAMLPSEDAVLFLLFGLLMSGHIRARKMGRLAAGGHDGAEEGRVTGTISTAITRGDR